MRKVYVELKVRLIILQDDDIETSDVINELDFSFSDTTTKANIVDESIIDYEITDSK